MIRSFENQIRQTCMPQNHNSNKTCMQTMEKAVPERISDKGFSCRYWEFCLVVGNTKCHTCDLQLMQSNYPVSSARLWRPNVNFSWSLSFTMIVKHWIFLKFMPYFLSSDKFQSSEFLKYARCKISDN